jgi:hypothetical protein
MALFIIGRRAAAYVDGASLLKVTPVSNAIPHPSSNCIHMLDLSTLCKKGMCCKLNINSGK